ncbi:hypothetical protein BDV10DRAFT_189976 [Aspergillus recurvatus]
MTTQSSNRPRFYRNLQSFRERSVSTLSNLPRIHTTHSVSDSRSQSSTHSSDIAGYQNGNPSPSSSATINERASLHAKSATLDSIQSSPSETHPRFSATLPSMLTSLSHSATPVTPNNPTTPLLTLTRHVESQSAQARHLFTQKSHLLSQTEREWMESTISDTEDAMHEVLRLTEAFRVDQEVNNGRVGLKSQLRWLVRDSRRAKEERERLMLCHASLMGVLGSLQSIRSPDDVQVGFVQDAEPRRGKEGGSQGRSQGGTERGTERGTVDGTVDGSLEPPAPGAVYGLSASGIGPRPNSPVWDLSVQLQDAGMEVAVAEPELLPPKLPVSAITHSASSPMVKLPMQGEEEVAPEKLDDELLDMLSWRWAQGRQSQ